MRQLYAGIDLHSNNNHVGVLDQDDTRIFHKRLAQPGRRHPGGFGAVQGGSRQYHHRIDLQLGLVR